ncbi:MAG: inositol monophosphatase family protein [Anaerolineae bacterium]|jgi:myo-inositol-1(or 4)-monophosphatase
MSELLAFAQKMAREAGELLLQSDQERQTVYSKSTDIDLVTSADLASEKLLVDAIRAQYPAHSILSEEGLGELVNLVSSETGGHPAEGVDAVAAATSHLWLVDPLDGTVNYAHGYPCWGVTLAFAEHGRVVLGVVYDPLRDEMYWAEQGQGAWCNGRQLHVSRTSQLGEALVATGFAYRRATLDDTSHGEVLGNNLAEFGVIMPRVQGVRRAGAAVLDLAYLAAGRLDAYWEMYLNPWDWAAGSLLVEEAGGAVTGLYGQPWSLGKQHLAASNGYLHSQLVEMLAEARA